ncbi:M24 family metallopeptidase [Staphylothermus hellenicus]|uniref:M24 family metallopeptidase n=1 Tax=Staphylothermus hellenicus TaxID=84599 RepID=UPI001FE1F017|nr:Xaa-Pro peptidase family protein [Staphylothermus hellenicus]
MNSLKPQINKLYELVEKSGVEEVLLAAPDNIEYFLGIRTIADSVLLLHYKKGGNLRIYVPLLEYYRFRDTLSKLGVEVIAVSKTVKPSDARIVESDWKTLIGKLASSDKVGFDKSHVSPLNTLITSIYGDRIVDLSSEINKYRMRKEDWEIKSITRAVEITGKGIYEVANNLNDRITEAEVAGFFEYRVRREGVDEYAFPPLTLFKPGNSYPHNLPSNTRLGRKNLVLVDVGVKYNGRCSDITRMIIWRKISEEERKAVEAVNEAVDNVIDNIQPGIEAGKLADIAVKTLEKHGLSERFIHGLGHGFGVLVHEPPYIRIGEKTKLEPGMVFTVEPGVYFAGKYGVRIEEDVLVTERGVRVLSKMIERIITP